MNIIVSCLIITNSPSAKHISKRVCLSEQSCVASTPRCMSRTWLFHITTWLIYMALPNVFMKAKRCINRHWLYMNAWQRKIHSQTNRTWLIRITTWPFYITIWPFYITIFSITMKAKRCTNRHWLYVNAWRRKFRRYTNRTWQPHIITWLIYIAIPSGSRKVNLCTNRQ